MLTDEKRKKLLAGVLAAVMLTGTAGCANDKDSEWQNDNAAKEEKKDEGGGSFFSGFFPLVFYWSNLWCGAYGRRAQLAACA